MYSVNIEQAAVSYIKDKLIKTHHLSCSINECDREPSWDGFIYIYSDDGETGHKKEHMMYRVPCQVKGTLAGQGTAASIRYTVDVSDLRNYLNDKGVIFFVVSMSNDFNNRKIFYNALSPLRLKKILESCSTQKTKTLEFNQFPEDLVKQENLLLTFAKNSKKQESFVSSDSIVSFSNLMKNDSIKTIHSSMYGFSNLSITDFITAKDLYFFADTNLSGVSLPVNVDSVQIQATEKIKARIHIADTTFFHYFTRIIDKNKTVIEIGKVLIITNFHDEDKIELKYANPVNVRDIAESMRFLKALIEHDGFYIDGHKLDISRNKAEKCGFKLDAITRSLHFAEHCVAILDALNCQKDFEMNKLTNEDVDNLKALYIALVEKNPIPMQTSEVILYVRLKIENLTFLLIAYSVDKDNHLYSLKDFFDESIAVGYGTDDKNVTRASPYLFLKKNDFLEVSNVNFDKVLPSLKKYNTDKNINVYIENMLDEMRDAYKQCGKEDIR
jgi:hypothetical protein